MAFVVLYRLRVGKNDRFSACESLLEIRKRSFLKRAFHFESIDFYFGLKFLKLQSNSTFSSDFIFQEDSLHTN
jgi:hypothetical protein